VDASSSGSITITLPDATIYPNALVKITRVDTSQTNLVTITTINPAGSTIGGAVSQILQGANASLTVVPDQSGSDNYAIVNDTRFAQLHETGSTTTISGSLATVVWTTEDYNVFGTQTSSGVWTANVAGQYKVDLDLQQTATYALNNVLDLQLQVNGTARLEDKVYAPSAVTALTGHVHGTITLGVGDTVQVQTSNSGTGPAIAGHILNQLSLVRVGFFP
jgi:hypothetical protein